ncbi:aspartate aminotransferase family protein [Mycolicibacterium madagascariense]|uniref:Aspartate aminotransferase family protein n=1 Tax=Mycolicibacterium madagascariense TaxID=212765 RepID=A0A7I7XBA0_9MYCO|nr:aminotransferase class V-fold PLP-dependent enzyme [Mycolicibacterium madagascariense]MCV7013390.1 aspartate aminotransferase family protein [Mycolicibacterium madagascariense]BBZ25891.1 aspartate aminotransferase family protein [Mycolicibacterium madagascariense]
MSQTADEVLLMEDADRRARAYTAGIGARPVFPTADAVRNLVTFDEPLPDRGRDAAETLGLLDDYGTPATVETNGGRYFGFVTGATFPVAAAAERLVLAWDNAGLAHVTSPAAAKVEAVAARWVLDALHLPSTAGVGFTTSAGAGTLIAVAAARRALLRRHGWDVDEHGLTGAPQIRVVVSELGHVVITKALRVLGFGTAQIALARTDEFGRVDPAALPPIDDRTIVVLQAGEVNTGEFDPFAEIIPAARDAGAWVHVDGAFGLWARASAEHRHLTEGIDAADSWTVDGHKWLNTPYDSAMVILADRAQLAETMNSDAAYSSTSADSQKNLTLEFSRRPRGIAIWAALRTLGRDGVADLVERTTGLAAEIARGLDDSGYTVLNRVVINQIIATADTPEETARIAAAAQASGRTWFGTSVWRGEPVMRISVSSWRTTAADVDDLLDLLRGLKAASDRGVPATGRLAP